MSDRFKNYWHKPSWHSSLCLLPISPHCVSASFSVHTMSTDRRLKKVSVLGWVALSSLLTCTVWGKSHSLCWWIAFQSVCSINPVAENMATHRFSNMCHPANVSLYCLSVAEGNVLRISWKWLNQLLSQTLKNILLLFFLIVFRSLIWAKKLSSSMTPLKSWSGRRLCLKHCIQMPSMP